MDIVVVVLRGAQEAVVLVTPAQVLFVAGLGFAFGVFAAQFDAVPPRPYILTLLLALFGALFFVGLTLVRATDPGYPGNAPLRTMGTLALWWVGCATTVPGDRLARWWERRHP